MPLTSSVVIPVFISVPDENIFFVANVANNTLENTTLYKGAKKVVEQKYNQPPCVSVQFTFHISLVIDFIKYLGSFVFTLLVGANLSC